MSETETDVRRERARPMSPDERRAAIIAATTPLLIDHGASVTTRQIAEAAGIAEGTIFRVFADKRTLFQAVAEEVLRPPGARESMASYLADIPTIHGRIVKVVEQMSARSDQVMAVLGAMRQVWLSEGGPKPVAQTGSGSGSAQRKPGPPEFIVRANQELMDDLTEVLFRPYADQLRVSPADAALALRSLIAGAHQHPGLVSAQQRLTPDQVADLVLNGVSWRPEEGDS